ncbi:DUF1778 domain-containing protein [Rhodomicrobium udaipurense]|nr:DUF1778 domain-containing protein [Rhodomicrobium udaipurense]
MSEIETSPSDTERDNEGRIVLRLSAEDQIAFAKSLIAPPAPNERLVQAMRLHAEIVMSIPDCE